MRKDIDTIWDKCLLTQWILSLFLLMSAFAFQAHGQVQADALCERIYLQTDKSLYLAGETVYMKALTVTPDRVPLSFSKVAYVELVSETTSQLQIKIGLANGTGKGCMELPSNIPSGYYRLIAYTRFMRNEKPDVFFEKQIGIVNTFQPLPPKEKQAGHPSPTEGNNNRNTFALHTGKPAYTTREKGVLILDGLPEDIHSLSVSIAGKSSVFTSGVSNIRQWGEHIPALTENTSPEKYIAEYEGHIIAGKIVPIETTAIPDEGVNAFLSIPGEQIRVFTGKSEQANILFYTTGMYGVTDIVTTAGDASDKKYKIDIQSPFVAQHHAKELPGLSLVEPSLPDELERRNVALQVMLSAEKKSGVKKNGMGSYFKMAPNKTYLLDEYTRFSKMDDVIVEFVQGVRLQTKDGNRRLTMATKWGNELAWINPLVTLDGIPIQDYDILSRFNPLLVEKIDVYLNGYQFGGFNFKGIIAFSTFQHNYPGLVLDKSYQILNYAWPQAYSSLSVPDYSNEKVLRSRQPDFRHTILWEPDVQTSGKTSLEIPFFTSDFTGEFTVTVEGLSKDGQVIYASSAFQVE